MTKLITVYYNSTFSQSYFHQCCYPLFHLLVNFANTCNQIFTPSDITNPLLSLTQEIAKKSSAVEQLKNYRPTNQSEFEQFYSAFQSFYIDFINNNQRIFQFLINVFTNDPNNQTSIYKIFNFSLKTINQIKLVFTTAASAIRNDSINAYTFNTQINTVMEQTFRDLQNLYDTGKQFYDTFASCLERFIYDTQNINLILESDVSQSLFLLRQSLTYFDVLMKYNNLIYSESLINLK